MQYAYPAAFSEHPGTVIVTFRDFPEAVTEGRDAAEAFREAIDCLDTALLFRVKEGNPVPVPSRPRKGEEIVPASPSVAAKIAFIRAFAAARTTRTGLARRLGLHETEVRRMLDPDHVTKLDRLGEGLRALGRHLVVGDDSADAA